MKLPPMTLLAAASFTVAAFACATAVTFAAAADTYPKSRSAELDPALFRSPSSEFRGTPFWSWNTAMDEHHLSQIDALKAMGFGGVTIHSRTGLAMEYLGPKFMTLVQASVARARKLGMYVLLYDEDRWPSGFAGGLVTKDEERFRERRLLWTPKTEPQPGKLLGRFAVKLDEQGRLETYLHLADGAAAPQGTELWSAYLQISEPKIWHNNTSYVDTLNPEAIRRFAEITYDRYFKAVGENYGKMIPGMFTDEPQTVRKGALPTARTKAEVVLPFTDDFLDTYQKAYSQKLDELLPELYWELPNDRVSTARWRYHEHVAGRFAEAFAGTLGAWCDKQGFCFTGHMMAEEPLSGQSALVGDAMRSLQYFQQPGIDLLSDKVEFMTAKQAQSASHQGGRQGVLSELYGVTGWHFDFGGHKRQGDWQAALGITMRVPHLAWVSMAGEGKRDYPAAIGWQSPWYREYPLVEDHFARLNTALTRGAPLVRVAVVHPIESFWLAEGPLDQTRDERRRQDSGSQAFASWLIYGQMDYDYLCEASLPRLQRDEGRKFRVGAMAYDVVVVPQLRTIRSTTLERLERFADAGGTVVFAGDPPKFVDAQPSPRALAFAARCRTVAWSAEAVLGALEPWREVEVSGPDGRRADKVLYQLRQDGARRWLFACQNDRKAGLGQARISVGGDWNVTRYDTLSGRVEPLASTRKDGRTLVDCDLYAQGSVLLALDPGPVSRPAPKPAPRLVWTDVARFESAVPVMLSEPNVLLLDQPEWRWNDEDWQAREEVLRIDTALHTRLKLPLRGGSMAQPWTETQPSPVLGEVSLRYRIVCEVPVSGAKLALEEAPSALLTLDGKRVAAKPAGWWVDECYGTVALPELSAGLHELVITLPFTRKTNLEWSYLLGDFGVQVQGRDSRVIAPVRQLRPGSWVEQGLPFYAGNVTYRYEFKTEGQRLRLSAAGFQSPLLSVALNGAVAGKIAFAPYVLELGRPPAGGHTLEITAFGNRANAFGIIHHTNRDLPWYGPGAWRATGKDWTYDYNLRPTGLLEPASLQSSGP
jgi:hypothetical protein